MNMTWNNGAELIKKSLEKEEENKAWQMWLTLYPNMNKKNFIPFTKFYKKGIPHPSKKIEQTTDEIMAKAEELRLAHQGKHAGIKHL